MLQNEAIEVYKQHISKNKLTNLEYRRALKY